MPGRAEHRRIMRAIKALPDADLLQLLEANRVEIEPIALRVNRLKAQGDAIRKELGYRRFKAQGYSVSDHAIVRYLERRMGVDVQAVREEIVEMVKRANGDGRRRFKDGETDIVFAVDEDQKVITTILTPLELDAPEPGKGEK